MFQHMLKKWISGLILVLLAAACTPATPAPIQEERLGSLESKVEMLSQIQLDLTSLRFKVDELSGDKAATAELQSRLDDLQKRLDTLAAEIEAIPSTGATNEQTDNSFDVALVQYVLDSAGFHVMAANLEETKKIDPTYLESVNRAKKVLVNAQLPAALNEQNQSFIKLLDELVAALEADKGDAAAELAKKVHGAQHGFTKAIDDWMLSAKK